MVTRVPVRDLSKTPTVREIAAAVAAYLAKRPCIVHSSAPLADKYKTSGQDGLFAAVLSLQSYPLRSIAALAT